MYIYQTKSKKFLNKFIKKKKKKKIEIKTKQTNRFFKAALEEKLRAMKMRLAQIAEIPLIIQSTLESVSKTFEGFLPPEPEPEPQIPQQNDATDTDDIISIDSLDASDAKETDRDESEEDGIRSELSLTSSEYSKDEDGDDDDEGVKDDCTESEHEPTPELEPTEEQIMKMEKQVKVRHLNFLNFSMHRRSYVRDLRFRCRN